MDQKLNYSWASKMLLPMPQVFNFVGEEDYYTIKKYIFSKDYDGRSFVLKEGDHGDDIFFIAWG